MSHASCPFSPMRIDSCERAQSSSTSHRVSQSRLRRETLSMSTLAKHASSSRAVSHPYAASSSSTSLRKLVLVWSRQHLTRGPDFAALIATGRSYCGPRLSQQTTPSQSGSGTGSLLERISTVFVVIQVLRNLWEEDQSKSRRKSDAARGQNVRRGRRD